MQKISVDLKVSLEQKINFWSEELLSQCSLCKVKIHFLGYYGFYGIIKTIKGTNDGSVLMIELEGPSSSFFQEDILKTSRGPTKLRLEGCKKPIFIKEDKHDCVWFVFDEGYAVVYFLDPKTDSTFLY